MTKIKGVKNWYCSLEMKGKFGIRPLAAASKWMFIVDSGWALDGCWYFLVGSGWLASMSWGCMHMQRCRHKKDQKSEAKKIADTRV